MTSRIRKNKRKRDKSRDKEMNARYKKIVLHRDTEMDRQDRRVKIHSGRYTARDKETEIVANTAHKIRRNRPRNMHRPIGRGKTGQDGRYYIRHICQLARDHI